MAKTRIESIDVAKGIGILLVVFGHTLSPVMDSHPFVTWLYLVIYTFHMPLFFFLSGFLATKLVTKPVAKTQLVKQRLSRLMIPYCVWAIIYLPMKFVMSEYVRFTDEYKWYSFFLGNNPDGQLWFLYVLFILSLIMIFFVTKNNITAFAVVFMIASFVAPAIPYSIGFTGITLNFSLYQSGFFFLGTLIALKFDLKKATKNTAAFVISLIVVIAYCVILWYVKNHVWYLKAFVAVCAIYVCLYICNLIDKTKVKKPLIYLGKKSMEIFILHGPLLVVGRIVLPKLITNTALYVIVLSAVAITISVLISLVTDKIKIVRLLLFGSK